MTVRRETLIALRARHQAHRIASEILNPPLEPPPLPTPAMPILNESDGPRTPGWQRLGWALLWALAILVLAGECLFILHLFERTISR